jgi:hypothetical protein
VSKNSEAADEGRSHSAPLLGPIRSAMHFRSLPARNQAKSYVQSDDEIRCFCCHNSTINDHRNVEWIIFLGGTQREHQMRSFSGHMGPISLTFGQRQLGLPAGIRTATIGLRLSYSCHAERFEW